MSGNEARLLAFEVADHLVSILGDTVKIWKGNQVVLHREVSGLGKFVASRQMFGIGHATMDEDLVIFVYDPHDGNFGYAINIRTPEFSEWGYAPFPVSPGLPGPADKRKVEASEASA
ncbi:MAG: hypothetical protein AB1486_18620 [Planctomycetota bacterium]